MILLTLELGHLFLESDAAAWQETSAETPKIHKCQRNVSEQAIVETLSSVRYTSPRARARL
jgi:hypothetical protein